MEETGRAERKGFRREARPDADPAPQVKQRAGKKGRETKAYLGARASSLQQGHAPRKRKEEDPAGYPRLYFLIVIVAGPGLPNKGDPKKKEQRRS